MKNRSEAREIIIKIIYQIDIMKEAKLDYDISELIHDQTEIENDFINQSIFGILEHEKDIIKLANKYLKDWTLDRLSKVDQAIIKLAIYELIYTDTPSIVAINEALELSHKYSEENVTKMINGILDKIYHEEEK